MINNAGFCRDKTIFGMSDDEFDSVVRVHLRGHFVNMRNATAYWRDKAKPEKRLWSPDQHIFRSGNLRLAGTAKLCICQGWHHRYGDGRCATADQIRHYQ